jgi:hypothetical protein
VKDFYRDFGGADLRQLYDLYASDAEFVDPVHAISGVDAMLDYFSAGRQGLISCSFDYQVEISTQETFALEWEMHFAHRRLNGANPILVKGCSLMALDAPSGLIKRHVDYYDLGEMLYENVPALGYVVKKVKRKLAV